MDEEHYAYLLVEDEKWWSRRCIKNRAGNSVHSFVRRGTVGPKEASKILFYVKLPVRQIKGVGEFIQRITGAKDELWNVYGPETVFETKEEFDQFIGSRNNVTFIRFKGMEELDQPKGFNILYAATCIKKMPNGGMYLSRETVNQIII